MIDDVIVSDDYGCEHIIYKVWLINFFEIQIVNIVKHSCVHVLFKFIDHFLFIDQIEIFLVDVKAKTSICSLFEDFLRHIISQLSVNFPNRTLTVETRHIINIASLTYLGIYWLKTHMPLFVLEIIVKVCFTV